MKRSLSFAALLAGVLIGATPAYAWKFEYLPSDKCTLSPVPVGDNTLMCKSIIKKQFQDDCTASGGEIQRDGRACKLPDDKAKAFRDLIDRKTGLPGPYNPGPDPTAMTTKPDPKSGCIRGTENLPCAK